MILGWKNLHTAQITVCFFKSENKRRIRPERSDSVRFVSAELRLKTEKIVKVI